MRSARWIDPPSSSPPRFAHWTQCRLGEFPHRIAVIFFRVAFGQSRCAPLPFILESQMTCGFLGPTIAAPSCDARPSRTANDHEKGRRFVWSVASDGPVVARPSVRVLGPGPSYVRADDIPVRLMDWGRADMRLQPPSTKYCQPELAAAASPGTGKWWVARAASGDPSNHAEIGRYGYGVLQLSIL